MLSVHLSNLDSLGKCIDVICCTEHFIESGYEDQLCIPNYNLASCYSRQNVKRGGACILVKNGIKYKSVELQDISISSNMECCAVELTDYAFIILCLYRVPKMLATELKIFFTQLNKLLKLINKKRDKTVVLCGDFNIDILKPNKTSQKFIHILTSHNLTLAINEPTRLQSKTCIDNFAHNDATCCQAEVVDLGLSDHTAQILKCNVKKTCKLKFWRIKRRDYCDENLKKFKEYLNQWKFTDLYTTDDPNEAYNRFLDIFLLLYELCFPLKYIKISCEKRVRWISKGIKLCTKRQRTLLWNNRINPSEVNKSALKTYTQRLRKIIKLTQKSINSHLIRTSVNKSKTTWKIINSTKPYQPREPIRKLKDDNNTLITDPIKIANTFNDHFIDQITTPPMDLHMTYNLKFNSQPSSLFISPTISYDIIKIIKSLKNKTSVGYDNISTNVIKYVNEIISPHLSHIINLCIVNGTFPAKLKTTIIKPIYKKGDKNSVHNYRPIALIPIISKIFENVIYNSVYNYLDKYNILVEQQKGFRKGKSINLAIYDFLADIIRCVDSRVPVSAIYMDMTKAFDYVNHKILLQKMEFYGVRGTALKLIKSYLNGRTQQTQLSNICIETNNEVTYTSNDRLSLHGVPQGSILGPLIFLLYINDLPLNVSYPMTLFADDSTAVIKKSENKNYEHEINKTLQEIMSWLESNCLKANLSKTKIMHFTQKTNPPPVNLVYNNVAIQQEHVTKFLGLTIDHNLSWKYQAEVTCNKLSKSAYALYKLSKIVSRDAVLSAFHGYVMSTLRFGIVFWGNCTEVTTIFKAQKRCLRAMCQLKSTETCKPYFKALKILTLTCLYVYEVAVFVKTNESLFPKAHENSSRTIRHPHKLKIESCKTAFKQKSIVVMGPKIYNKLPDNLKSLNTIQFKRKLYDMLTNKCYYDMKEFFEDKL